MECGWKDEAFGALSRELFFADRLMDEVLQQNVDEVRRLLRVHDARADLVVPERGAAALHLLAGLQAEDFAAAVVLSALRRSGADPDVRSEEGLTPLHVAATYGRCRVLEVLLTNGADATLVDYRLLLDAEEHAYRERQWQAYSMLTTYAAILKHSKYEAPEDDLLPEEKSWDDHSSDELTYEASATDQDKRSDYDGVSSEKEEVCDWLKKTLEVIPLDENAVNIVKNHRRQTETYQFPADQQDEFVQDFDDTLSGVGGVSRSSRGENKVLAAGRFLEDNLPWLRSLKPRGKVSKQSCVESSSSRGVGLATETNLACRSSRSGGLRDADSTKRNTRNSTLRESEMYVYGYAESSLKSTEPRLEADEISSVCLNSNVDQTKDPNSNMLYKMSRILLFILKKRHSMSPNLKCKEHDSNSAQESFKQE